MEIEKEMIDSVTVLTLKGNMDSSTAPLAQETITGLLNEGVQNFLIDFAELNFISSAGLRVLLGTEKKLAVTGGTLRICNLNEIVMEVFEMSGFTMIIKISETRQDALDEFLTE